jgi:dolichyl-phosphate-mannose--protein O-mannosyl transferase
MGLGVASKWTGAYAGIGLAILFFATLYRRYREYKYATLHPREYTETIPHKKVIREFKPNTTRTIGFCMIFFVAIPFLIYLLSYIPFNDGRDDGIFARMLRNQVDMFSYHSNEATPHPYSSKWYEWPLIVRPVWYFSSIVTGSYLNGGLREGISAFGNPLVWWIGIPITFVMLYLALFKKDKKATFLLVGYAAQFLPWTLISRTTYMYHYFPSVIFIVLMIAYAFQQCAEHLGKKKLIFFCSIYGAAVIALFILFYPVLSGQPVEAEFVTRWLRWFDSWVLTLT